MSKAITVTEKNIHEFYPYQGQNKKLQVGDVLEVIKEKCPYVWESKTPGRGNHFAIVTDWQPSPNSLEMIRRENDPDADKYGWKFGANVMKETLTEKKQSYAFNRWSINQKLIPKK